MCSKYKESLKDDYVLLSLQREQNVIVYLFHPGTSPTPGIQMIGQLLSNPIFFYGSAFVVSIIVFFGVLPLLSRWLHIPWYNKDGRIW